jgi:hypothetical protein
MYRTIFVLFLLSFTTACSLVKDEVKTEDVDKYAAIFFERLANADYNKIYQDSSESFRKENSQSAVYDTLKQMTELGKPGTLNRISMSLEKQGSKRIALPSYLVNFNDRRVTVNFMFVDEDGEWKLGAYEVKQRAG